MSWASKRRTAYVTGIVIFFALLFGVPAIYHFATIPPTCHDGIQNGGETGVDMGGPCLVLDPNSLQPSAVLWARSFKVRDGTYSAVAEIDNPNQDAGVAVAQYTFSLYDSDNIIVAQRSGTTFIMPGAVTPVFESRIDTGNRIVAHTYFQFTGPLIWERMTNPAGALSVAQWQVTNADTAPSLTATASNSSAADATNPIFVAVLYDAAGNAFAASETQLPLLQAGGSSPVVFTWPDPFSSVPASIDILPLLPPRPVSLPPQDLPAAQ